MASRGGALPEVCQRVNSVMEAISSSGVWDWVAGGVGGSVGSVEALEAGD